MASRNPNSQKLTLFKMMFVNHLYQAETYVECLVKNYMIEKIVYIIQSDVNKLGIEKH